MQGLNIKPFRGLKVGNLLVRIYPRNTTSFNPAPFSGKYCMYILLVELLDHQYGLCIIHTNIYLYLTILYACDILYIVSYVLGLSGPAFHNTAV